MCRHARPPRRSLRCSPASIPTSDWWCAGRLPAGCAPPRSPPSPGAAAGVDAPGAPVGGAARARRAAVAAAIRAGGRGPPGTCGAAGPSRGGGGMTGSLIDRVRERLAAESAPLRPTVVADAIRAESGGVLGDTEVLSSLRTLQTELTGAGILEPLLCADDTTDVLVTAPGAVWVDDGNGLRRTTVRFADEAAVR